jgi:hypothetical protein
VEEDAEDVEDAEDEVAGRSWRSNGADAEAGTAGGREDPPSITGDATDLTSRLHLLSLWSSTQLHLCPVLL